MGLMANSPVQRWTQVAAAGVLLVGFTACATTTALPVTGLVTGSVAEPSSTQWGGIGRVTSRGPNRFRESEFHQRPFSVDSHLGIRTLDDERFGDLDRQTELGVSFLVPLLLDDPNEIEDTRTGFLSLVSYDFGARYAIDNSETTQGGTVVERLESQTLDFHVGLLVSPFQWRSRFQPYLAGGLAFVFVDTDLNSGGTERSDRDSALTAYLRTGARVRLDYGRHVGLDVRWLNDADVQLDGLGADIGAVSVTVTFGASF